MQTPVYKITKFIFLFSIFCIFSLSSITISYSSDADKIFLSLRNKTVNLRQGPSFDYPIKLVYKKKFLPVELIDKSGPWRKIKDIENNVGWIHIALLSKKKTAITIKDNIILNSRASIYSEPKAIIKKGRLVFVKRCKNIWCKIQTGKFHGWIPKNTLWGKIK